MKHREYAVDRAIRINNSDKSKFYLRNVAVWNCACVWQWFQVDDYSQRKLT